MTALSELALEAGLATAWTDATGQARQVDDTHLSPILDALDLPCATHAQCQDSMRMLQSEREMPAPLITADLGAELNLATIAGRGPIPAHVQCIDEYGCSQSLSCARAGYLRLPAKAGYYQLQWAGGTQSVAVAPAHCFGVADVIPQPRSWGVSAQVYALARSGDGGIGDSAGVEELCRRIALYGGDAVGLSPLHAMPPDMNYYSPYAPSDRCFFNVLHTDPDQILGRGTVAHALSRCGLTHAWTQQASMPLIDWPVGTAMRLEVMRAIFDELLQTPTTMRAAFLAFEQDAPESLRTYSAFTAQCLTESIRAQDEARFQCFMQWLSVRAWEHTQGVARAEGMRIGLVLDIAVGFERDGSEASRHRDAVLRGLSLGAPPDLLGPAGQVWGVTSYSPRGLRASGYRPFIELLRANMRVAGAIRIDHVLGLLRLWVVPNGAGAEDGAYLRYPFDDLLRLVALESWRQRCVVVGEDLGTVPQGLREALAARGVLGFDVLLFTRQASGSFLPPSQWRKHAVATTTTHDTPTLLGWQQGKDLRRTVVAGKTDSEDAQCQLGKRDRTLAQMDLADATQMNSSTLSTLTQRALHWVASSASELAMFPMEDLLALAEQPNVPGTTHSEPNWRRRLPQEWDGRPLRDALILIDDVRKRETSDA